MIDFASFGGSAHTPDMLFALLLLYIAQETSKSIGGKKNKTGCAGFFLEDFFKDGFRSDVYKDGAGLGSFDGDDISAFSA